MVQAKGRQGREGKRKKGDREWEGRKIGRERGKERKEKEKEGEDKEKRDDKRE